MWLKCYDGKLINLDRLCQIEVRPDDAGEDGEMAWSVVGYIENSGWTMEESWVVLHIAQSIEAADGYMQALMARLYSLARFVELNRVVGVE